MALDLEHGVGKDLTMVDTSPLPTHGSKASQNITRGGYEGVIEDETFSTEDDTSSAMSVSKQVEMEADHAIKYRTCSWQKVSSILNSLPCRFHDNHTIQLSTFYPYGQTANRSVRMD